jgi:hypothetical protein
MKHILIFQAFLALVGPLLVSYFVAQQQAYSFFVGSLVILVSVFLLGWAWSLIFKKKLVALAAVIIVIKYAILGIIIFELAKQAWFRPLWFSLGVASFTLTAIFYALKETLTKGNEDGF